MEEAIRLLELWLQLVTERSYFSSDQITDLLLDFQQALLNPPAGATPVEPLEPVLI